jgi:large subunit ribosomal protein L17
LLRNLAASLMMHERIRTTLAKAKELRPFAEKLVTLGKKDTLHARRRALSIVPRKEAIAKLFNDISPRFAERQGGYTRILKLGPRRGDGAEMAFIEFVDHQFTPGKEAKEPAKGKKAREEKKPKKEAKETEPEVEVEAAAEEAEEAEEEKPAKKKAAKKAAKKTTKKASKKTTKKAAKKTTAKKTTKKATKKKAAKKTKKKT